MLPSTDEPCALSAKADQSLIGKKAPIVRRSLKKRAEGIDFFRLAAALANPKNADDQSVGCSTENDDDDLHRSPFLDASFQDASPIFNAVGSPWQRVAISAGLVSSACEKYARLFGHEILLTGSSLLNQTSCASLFNDIARPILKRDIWFSGEEFAILLSAIADPILRYACAQSKRITSAIDLHERVAAMSKDDTSPWGLVTLNEHQQESSWAVNRMRQFSSLRLQQKSQQKTSGADRLVRYFHVAMRSGEANNPVNVFYWLKFDQNQQVQAGDFIFPEERVHLPINLFRPHEIFTSLIASPQQAGFSFGEHFATVELLKMYLDSVD